MANAKPSLSQVFKKKGSKFGFWHKRYCTLVGNRVNVFKDERSREAERVVTITPSSRIDIQEQVKGTPRFTIISADAHPLCLGHESIDIIRNWVQALRDLTLQTTNLSMASFQMIRVIGRGFYGKVMLCKKIDDGQFYAIKTVHKERLVNSGKVHTIFNEKETLMRARHPFIVNLCFSFQNAGKVYLGLEYVGGGELFYHLQRRRTFPLEEVRLYIAELSLAINYLHVQGIIYRDIKPENILLDEKGHIKLTDFGMVKLLDSDEETTATFCGTSEYLAPEIIARRPYGMKIDWWALGVLTYELLFGGTPFYNDNKAKMFEAICTGDVRFPSGATPPVQAFIKLLLMKDPEARGSFEQIKKHAFFAGMDFEKVFRREYTPAFVPVTDGVVGANFDAEFTAEVAVDSFATPAVAGSNDFEGFTYQAQGDAPPPSSFNYSDD